MSRANKALRKSLVISCMATNLLLPTPSQADCLARSGTKTAALVELYTSEGCSSCPPADKRLADLASTLDAGAEIVPLALHVSYWDYIGWKDSFARKSFDQRQNWLVRLSQHDVIYTPQFFVAGSELRTWNTDLRSQVRRVNAQTPMVDIELKAKSLDGNRLDVEVRANLRHPVPDAALYLAMTEGRLTSTVTRGENRGATLTHNHVVREWLGPYALNELGSGLIQGIELQGQWNRAQLNLVAFVQDQRDGRILQAVSAHGCARTVALRGLS